MGEFQMSIDDIFSTSYEDVIYIFDAPTLYVSESWTKNSITFKTNKSLSIDEISTNSPKRINQFWYVINEDEDSDSYHLYSMNLLSDNYTISLLLNMNFSEEFAFCDNSSHLIMIDNFKMITYEIETNTSLVYKFEKPMPGIIDFGPQCEIYEDKMYIFGGANISINSFAEFTQTSPVKIYEYDLISHSYFDLNISLPQALGFRIFRWNQFIYLYSAIAIGQTFPFTWTCKFNSVHRNGKF